MITLEQVENLRERAKVSYEDAKAALEVTDGDMLEAVIYLEKKGKIPSPRLRTYNTRTGGESSVHGGDRHHGDFDDRQYGSADAEDYDDMYYYRRRHFFRMRLKTLWRKFCYLVKKANANHFEAYKDGKCLISAPVTLLVISALCFFWVTIPLLIIGLFTGCRYRFRGPDLDKAAINKVMDQAAETADNIKRSMMNNDDNDDKGNEDAGNDAE